MEGTLQRGHAERDRLQREQLYWALHPMSDSAQQNAWRIVPAANGVDRPAHLNALRHDIPPIYWRKASARDTSVPIWDTPR